VSCSTLHCTHQHTYQGRLRALQDAPRSAACSPPPTCSRVPVLDDYLDRINLMLWPRFKVLLDSQMSSIRAGAEQRLYNGEVAVHSVARRYAALCSSLLLLMNEHEQEDAGGHDACCTGSCGYGLLPAGLRGCGACDLWRWETIT
jgi:hypothetical protein